MKEEATGLNFHTSSSVF